MNLAYGAYALLSTGVFVSGLPFYCLVAKCSRRPQRHLSQRMGIYDKDVAIPSGYPRIWIHAVSVGEVNVAHAVIEAMTGLMPHCGVIVSTTTPHGQAMARKRLGDRVTCIYAPMDFIPSVRRALSFFKPDILVSLETEIWPNWLSEAHRMGIRTALVNGRLSPRSIKRYFKIRPLMKEVLSRLDAFSMISAPDADRIQLLGAPPHKVFVAGNAKYDGLTTSTETKMADAMAGLYRIGPGQPVWVAGSTRGAEGDLVLRVFRKLMSQFPQALLIIAPRHLKRVPELRERARLLGLPCQLRTGIHEVKAPRTASVVIVDTIGELHAIYAVASVVFGGGSLVPCGGQNIMEAAAWAKPVIYGPFMDDFLDAKALLESTGGGTQVGDELELAGKVAEYFSRPEAARDAGYRARQAVLYTSGAADRHAAVIHRLVSNRLRVGT